MISVHSVNGSPQGIAPRGFPNLVKLRGRPDEKDSTTEISRLNPAKKSDCYRKGIHAAYRRMAGKYRKNVHPVESVKRPANSLLRVGLVNRCGNGVPFTVAVYLSSQGNQCDISAHRVAKGLLKPIEHGLRYVSAACQKTILLTNGMAGEVFLSVMSGQLTSHFMNGRKQAALRTGSLSTALITMVTTAQQIAVGFLSQNKESISVMFVG